MRRAGKGRRALCAGFVGTLIAGAALASSAEAVVIQELRAGTAANGPSDEFVEVVNEGSRAVDLSGWTVAAYDETCTATGELLPASATETFPSGFWLGRGQHALVAADGFDGPDPDVTYAAADLIGPDGTLQLRDGSDTPIDTVGWDGEATITLECAESSEVVHELASDERLDRVPEGWDSDSNISDFDVLTDPATPLNRAEDGGVVVDSDGDGWADPDDNCASAANPQQQDPDGDGVGNPCDDDDDGDGVLDVDDNCRVEPNPDQLDTDLDGTGTACDPDAYNRIAGIVKPYAGLMNATGTIDGDRLTARFDSILGMDASGTDIYMTQMGRLTGTAANPPIVLPDSAVRKLDTATGQVSTIVTQEDFADAAAGWPGEGTHFGMVDIEHEGGFLYMTGFRMWLSPTPLGYSFEPMIIRHELATGELVRVPTGVSPTGPGYTIGGIESDGQNLYVGETNCEGSGRIMRIPVDGGPATTVVPTNGMQGCVAPNELELSPNPVTGEDELFTFHNHDLIRIDPDTGDTHTLIDNQSMSSSYELSHPTGITVTAGMIFITAASEGRSVWAVDRVTGAHSDTFAGIYCGSATPYDCGNSTPNNVTETGVMGPDVAWHANVLVAAGGRLYVADRPPHGDPDRFASPHVIREVEILPDAVAPVGSALLSSFTPERRAASSTLDVTATDEGEGRIPSGVRFLQVRPAGAAGQELPWADMSSTVVVPLAGALEIRFRDRASNSSPWVEVDDGDDPPPPPPPSPPIGSGGGSIAPGPPASTPPTQPSAKKKKKKRKKKKR